MSNVLKSKETPITEELLSSLIGKLVNVPTNEHEMVKQLTGEKEKVNVWFAGTVAGYEKQGIGYDYALDEFTETMVLYSLLLTDGHSYILSPTSCEIRDISEDDFLAMVEEQERVRAAKESILIPGKGF